MYRFPGSAIALAACAVLCAACSHGAAAAPHRPAPSHSPTSVPPSTSASRPPAPSPRTDPLTGLHYSSNPVVAVKIDDTAAARPQRGIDKADIVYIEQVEGGLTRLLAIFHSRLPTVESVRSTRANDPQLALEYGHIDYVASGGDRPELAPLDASPLRADINDRGGPGFRRDPSRVAPFNLEADLATIAAKLHGPGAHDIGLTWATRPPAASRSGRAVHTTVGATPVAFTWDPKLHRYVRKIGGVPQRAADGALISTPNVVVQFCRSTVYWRDRDVLGNPAQFTHTVGSGKVVVFRNGRRIDGTWHRRSVSAGTTLTTAQGKPIPLSPGGAWFVLTKKGTPLG